MAETGTGLSHTLGDILLAFSRVTSAGMGLGTDHGIRACYISMCLATDLELSPARAASVYYTALAKDGGCICGISQIAEFLDTDEGEAISDLLQRDTGNEFEMLRWVMRHAGRGSSPPVRARRVLGALLHGARFDRETAVGECEVAQHAAERLGLGDEAVAALTACSERWDGKGHPRRLSGEAIPLAARIINLSAAVEIADRLSGRDAAVELVRRRSGAAFDPAVAAAFLALAEREEFWEACADDEEAMQARVLALEPAATVRPTGGPDALDGLCELLADLVELKQPAGRGHARRVTELALTLAGHLDVSAGERVTLRRAGLLHELGIFTLSTRTLAEGPADATYRLHPLAPQQLLDTLPALQEACALAALHHERIDGTGWPTAAAAARQPLPARVLALACALDSRAGSSDRAAQAKALQTLAAEGGFDRDTLGACAAVLGTPRAVRTEWPAGLTEREVEVLRLGASGFSAREIGQRLVISHHTVRHHLESAYAKIGCTNRATASLFAAQHGLLD